MKFHIYPGKLDRGASLIQSPKRLEKVARQTGWMKRKSRKITPIAFLRGILLSITQGEPSLRLLATSIGLHSNLTVSKQALWERLGPEAVAFFGSVLAEVMTTGINAPKSIFKIPGIHRVLIADSTLVSLHERLAGLFPATNNQHGHCGAGFGLQGIFELISGAALELSLHPYRRGDQKASTDILPHLREGDLVIRDLGYMVLEPLKKISECGAHFLSRHLNNRVLHIAQEGEDGRVELLSYLRRHASYEGAEVDLDVVVGSNQKHYGTLECRLVARRLPQSVVEKRLRKARQNEERLSKKFTKEHLRLLAWEIYITSLPRAAADVAQLAALYRLRWRVEIIFKAMKSHTPGMDLARHRSNASHVQVLILAWMCLVALATRTGRFALASANQESDGGLTPNCVSLLKSMPRVFKFLEHLLYSTCSPNPDDLWERLNRQIQYHDRYEKRKKRSDMSQMLDEALLLT